VDKTIRYGWYSVRQAKLAGTVIFRTPDGKEVECSMTSSSKEHGTGWDDIALIGEVVEYVRRGQESEIPVLLADDPNPAKWSDWMTKMQRLIERERRETERMKDPGRWN